MKSYRKLIPIKNDENFFAKYFLNYVSILNFICLYFRVRFSSLFFFNDNNNNRSNGDDSNSNRTVFFGEHSLGHYISREMKEN